MDEGDQPGRLVCVVDDDLSCREALTGLLRSFGFMAEAFEGGPAFLASSHRWAADCLILDFRMPVMTGLEVQAVLLADGQTIPIIFVTSQPEPRLRDRALEAGAIAILRKPCDNADLIGHVRNAVGASPAA